ncbi:MAG: DNA mismatch repair protein MutS [Bacilli bacterium]|jgi:DNA mismatch repair protein MutS|nr:DNA mismatch repair protein MutS [Bacilli bacterium]
MKNKKEPYTPMMMQYLSIKKKYPDTLILFRLGDFYELFFDDAKLASRVLSLALTGKNAGAEDRVPMCGVPYHAIKGYIAKLITNGYKVGIVEQMEDPAEAVGLVDRDVVQIITPGAFIDYDGNENNYIASLDETEFNFVLAYCDLSTGELYVTNIEHDEHSLLSALDNIATKELVVKTDFSEKILEAIRTHRGVLISREDQQTLTLEQEPLLNEVQDLFQMKAVIRLVTYLQETQRRQLSYLRPAVVIKASKTLQIDAFSRLNLELTRTIRSEEKYGSLFWLLDDTKTAMGARELKKWISAPSSDLKEILRRQNIVSNLITNFLSRDELRDYLNEVYDLERLIARISFGNANGRDLLQLKNSLAVVPSIKSKIASINNENLIGLANKMNSLEDICQLIEKAISAEAPITIREGGIFNPGYNQELDELLDIAHNSKKYIASLETKERERTGIKNLRIGFNKVFGYYIEISNSFKPLIKDEYGYIRKQTTVNGERFITEELKEKEALILSADEKQKKLEYQLFVELRDIISRRTLEIQNLANALAELDVLASLAEVSAKNRYVAPTFNHEREINIIDGKHPVIDKVLKQSKFVANDILMDANTDVLLITGPNMGGKSTYMREMALIVILAQIGSFVPAKAASLPVFDQIFTRIGASDDLVSGQSTFMVEMSETNYALRHASSDSLLLFDEIGRGTSTFDGMALAQAIIEYVTSKIHAKTLFSTHYHELTKIDEDLAGIKNIHVEVKEENDHVTFLYKVLPGSMNKSYGINVARLAHLPDDLLARAAVILSTLEKKDVPFSSPTEDTTKVVEDPWIEEVRRIDPLAMTPLEALNFLYDIKKKM